MQYKFLIACFVVLWMACDKSGKDPLPKIPSQQSDIVMSDSILSNDYLGNGVQWGGYDYMLDNFVKATTLNQADWNTLYKRLSFMRPGLIRLLCGKGDYMTNEVFTPEKRKDLIFKMLDFCQQNNISVIWGEWGHYGANGAYASDGVDQNWINHSIDFLEYLVKTKGYTCIQYMNLVNEPNSSTATTKGNYELWKDIITRAHARMVDKNLHSLVKIIGPDITITTNNLYAWINDSKNHLKNQLSAYDIHTYALQNTVYDGSYTQLLRSYKSLVPQGQPFINAELGLKINTESELGQINQQLIKGDPYAASSANYLVQKPFYGIDMAAMLIQNLNAGMNGCVLWRLDDAMFPDWSSSTLKLTGWGFWNILGSELFGDASREEMRPWFFTMSLMSRYFPKGATIYKLSVPNKVGLFGVYAQLNGKYSIALVNTHSANYSLNLKMKSAKNLANLKWYRYHLTDTGFQADFDAEGFAKPYKEEGFNFSATEAMPLTVNKKSFLLMTNMD